MPTAYNIRISEDQRAIIERALSDYDRPPLFDGSPEDEPVVLLALIRALAQDEESAPHALHSFIF